jgi:hypothetical protein
MISAGGTLEALNAGRRSPRWFKIEPLPSRYVCQNHLSGSGPYLGMVTTERARSPRARLADARYDPIWAAVRRAGSRSNRYLHVMCARTTYRRKSQRLSGNSPAGRPLSDPQTDTPETPSGSLDGTARPKISGEDKNASAGSARVTAPPPVAVTSPAAGCSYARSSPLAAMLSPPVAEISHRGRAVVSEVEPAVRVPGLQNAPHTIPAVGVPFSTFPSAN